MPDTLAHLFISGIKPMADVSAFWPWSTTSPASARAYRAARSFSAVGRVAILSGRSGCAGGQAARQSSPIRAFKAEADAVIRQMARRGDLFTGSVLIGSLGARLGTISFFSRRFGGGVPSGFHAVGRGPGSPTYGLRSLSIANP